MDYHLIRLNTARNSLRYVIRAFNIKELYVPYYICQTVRNVLYKEKCKIIYYHIDNNFKPIMDFPSNAFILYPNYWGVCTSIIEELSNKYENLIVDNAHSFYSAPKGIASFNSLRKFFPTLRDGSFLFTKKNLDIDICKDEYFYNSGIYTYEELSKNEFRLNYEELKYISNCTYEKYKNLNIDELKQKRLNKFYYWHKKYFKTNLLNISLQKDDVPFVYPYLLRSIEDANDIVNTLKKESIDVFRLWNNFPDSFCEKQFYTNLVAIPLNILE